MTIRKFGVVAVVLILLGLSYGFVNFNEESAPSIEFTISHYDKYNNAVADVDKDTFLGAGFSAGDSVIIKDSQGHTHQGVVTSYWTCLFTGEYFISYGSGSDVTLGLDFINGHFQVGDKVAVRKTGTDNRFDILVKYQQGRIPEQGSLSDEVFANFREVSFGDIAEGTLYRSSSPFKVDPRYPVVDRLMEKYGVNAAVDLADTAESIEKKIDSGQITPGYAYGLYEDGHLIANNGGVCVFDEEFIDSVKAVFRSIADDDGPYLVFCDAGKDRTGIMMMLLEGLMNASVYDIVDDFMLSYTNLNGITSGPEYDLLEKKIAERMAIMLFDTEFFLSHEVSDVDKVDISSLNPHDGAVKLLKGWFGLDDALINKVVEKLSD